MKIKSTYLPAIVLAALASVANPASADVVTDWNLITVNATKIGGLNSNLGTRIDAIEAIAVYDAVNSITHFGTPYHYDAMRLLSGRLRLRRPRPRPHMMFW